MFASLRINTDPEVKHLDLGMPDLHDEALEPCHYRIRLDERLARSCFRRQWASSMQANRE
jgi:hypothetical protein